MKNSEFIFKPRARLLLQLGEQLIRNESIAILELVKNSYDADATEVSVKIRDLNRASAKICILDDGSGMNLHIVKNYWLEPGNSPKEAQIHDLKKSRKFSRLPLGEKGIGRFGAHKLGDQIELVSRMENSPEVVISINWKNFLQVKYLSEVPISVSERAPVVFQGNRTGTQITITQLRGEWNRPKIRDIQRSLTSLCSPFQAQDTFKVILDTDEKEWTKGLLTWSDIRENALFYVRALLEKDRIKKFSYKFSPWPAMHKLAARTVGENSPEVRNLLRMIREDQTEIDLSKSNIGSVLFEALVFDRDSRVLELGVTDKRGLKEYLDQNGGIRVYRDGMRVLDYGEPGNDWLDLGTRRVNTPSIRVSNNLITGAVQISRQSSKGLIEKSNREGFLENEAYQNLKDSVLYVLNIAESLRRQDKDKIRLIYGPTNSSEPVISSIDRTRKLVEKRVKDADTKSQITKLLDRIETDYRYINETLLKSASAGLSFGVVIHEAEKVISELNKIVTTQKTSGRIVALVKRLSQLVEGYALIIRNSGKSSHLAGDIITQAFFNVEFRLEAHNIKTLINKESRMNIPINCALNLVIGAIINLIDNSIWWLRYGKIPTKKIYVSVEILSKNEVVIIFADNGPGFSLPTSELSKPFVTTKPNGMGLGLHIVHEVMAAHGGKLIFPEPDDFELPREFRKGAIIGLSFRRGN